MEIYQDTWTAMASELGSGERLLWSGRPRQGIFLKGSDAIMIPFSLMWGGFAIFWEIMALSMLWSEKASQAPLAFRIMFPLWGVPFVLVGLYLMVGRFFIDAKQREKTIYAVTNQRIIIRSGLFKPTSDSMSLRSLPEVSLTEGAVGRGTITFGPANLRAARAALPCFESIDDARRVYEVIRSAQSAA